MGRRKFSRDQVAMILEEYRSGVSAVELCQKYGMSKATFYKWRAKYLGPGDAESADVETLREENRKLRDLLAEMMLENHTLRNLVGNPSRAGRGGR